MGERIWANGNQAVGWGAVSAGCLHFFGYPITPQNEVTEWFAAELPKRGGSFVQGESEWSVAAMVYGCSASGVRCITSTSSPGWGLMQEVLSNFASAEVPGVFVNIQRGGPGQGTTQHAQTDYLSVTRGGHGGYKSFVLVPNSIQEICDYVQWAFYLSEKYRVLAIVLADAIIGQMAEPLNIQTLDFGPVPPKTWATTGMLGTRQRPNHITPGWVINPYVTGLAAFQEKWNRMQSEVKFEALKVDDAELVLVAFGYPSRVCMDVVEQARSEGLKVGMLRPQTVWPFPTEAIRKKASQKGVKFLVVEDNLGQMIDDVRLAVEGRAPVHHLGITARHLPSGAGMLMPTRVLEEVKKLI
ncbi:MAG: transketolase C-terminal domain-containing protein [Dehalococcoidia bacterium]|nr:transketolase C-terminal domain-containing protein [Dehalococcoidia bacterium]